MNSICTAQGHRTSSLTLPIKRSDVSSYHHKILHTNTHNFDLKMHVWQRAAYYMRVINFSKNYRNLIIACMVVNKHYWLVTN